MITFLRRLFGQHTYGAEITYRIGDISYYVAVDTTDRNAIAGLLRAAMEIAEEGSK